MNILRGIRGITPRHFIRDMENSILGIRSFDEKIDFVRNNNKSFVDMITQNGFFSSKLKLHKLNFPYLG